MPEIGLDTRAENLDRLDRETFDVCVVGGGITGAGIAFDASSRGLSVALVEKGDFASGTSSKSSKMIHGGLRYLAEYDFGLTWEASRERDLLRRLAPHLVRPLRFLFPAYRKGIQTRFATIGLALYDLVAAGRGFERHRRVEADDVRTLAPTLDPDRIVGAWTYWDAGTDDARLVFELIRSAHELGAVAANYARVHGFDHSNGRIAAAFVTDETSGREITLRGRCFVNAAGVWAGEVARLTEVPAGPPLQPAKGVHVVVRVSRAPVACGVVIPSVARDRRSLFAVPGWGDTVVIGTTDTPYDGELDEPSVDADDVRYALSSANWSLGIDLSPDDVVAAWAGLRPLLAGAGGPQTRTADLSRKHHLSQSDDGLVTITGGKMTTYRRMAADTVDLVCDMLDVRARSRTNRLPIGLTRDLQSLIDEAIATAERIGVHEPVARHLVETYGDRAQDVLALAAETPALALPLSPGQPWIAAQAVWAVRHEMAVSLSDVVERRTRLSLADRDAGLSSRAPQLVASELGWSDIELVTQRASVATTVGAERGPVAALSDTSASEQGSARRLDPEPA